MGLYELHKLLFDLNSHADVKAEYENDRETVYSRYNLTEDELAALRANDIYRLHKFGVNSFLLAPYAQSLGHALADFGEILRAGTEAERQQSSS